MNISTGKWILAAVIVASSVVPVSSAVDAAPYLEADRTCSGAPLAKPERFKIVGWDGQRRYAQGERVYSFRVVCNNSERDIIDLFLAGERSDRYKRDGNVLSHWARSERRSVKTRDAGCRKVPKRVRTHPSSAEARAACRHQPMPMACEIDVMAQDRWENRMVEDCWRAEFETRDVPVWKSFPEGHAPLPRGARIVQVAAKTAATASRPARASGTRDSGQSGGSAFWLFALMALSGGGALYYFQRRNRDALREQVASARAQMGQGQAGFGAGFDSEGFQTSAGTNQEDSYDERANWDDQANGTTGQDEPTPSADDLPETLEEACALLNVTPDTPHDEVNKVYKAMAMVWHADRGRSESERQRCEAKMKQLNAARELILGKR